MNKKNEPLKMTYMRALENYKKRDYKNAATYCYKILSIDSYHLDSILMLASIAGSNKDYDQAKELLVKAIEIQPKNTTAIHNLGTCYKELKKFDNNITSDIFRVLSPLDSMKSKKSLGGSAPETVKKFVLLPRQFSIDKGEMTPKMSIVRKRVIQNYNESIDSIYN